MVARGSFGSVVAVAAAIGWALAVLSVLGCAPPTAVRAEFVGGEAIPVPEGAPQYTAAPQPGGVVGGRGLESLRTRVATALADRGEQAQPDGALGAAASWTLNEANAGRTVGVMGIEAAARHFGFGGVVLGFMVFGMDGQDTVNDQLERIPHNLPITRYGVCVSPSGRSATVLVGGMEASFDPIVRAAQPGDSVRLRGAVGPRFATSHLYLTKPDGTVDERRGASRAFDATFALAVPGQYRLEVMGDGATGPVVVSNLPLWVGVPEPAPSGFAGTALSPEQAEPRLLALLNDARRAAGVGPLAPDAELREMALSHSEDMAEHDFLGHVSPTTGTPDDRLRKSGILVSIAGENVGAAPTPELVHDGLMNSPGHRMNMLRPEYTHVGIGATQKDKNLVVTMEFGRRPSPSVIPTSAGQVVAALLALRSSRNLPGATADPVYGAAAQAAADVLANGGDPDDVNDAVKTTMDREVNRLHTSRPGACVVSVNLLELVQLADVAPLSRPGLGLFGVGARLRKDARGTRLCTVFMLQGVSCN